MGFEAELDANAVVEWREAYIDYGRIKKLIAEASNSSEGSRGMETLYPPADNLNDSELKIFHTLDAELEKTQAFYTELLARARKRQDVLSQQYRQLARHREQYKSAVKRTSLYLRTVMRLCKTIKQRLFPEAPSGSEDDSSSVHPSYDRDPLGYGQAYRKLDAATCEYYVYLESIQRYCDWSKAGFAKATKKVEQEIQIKCHEEYMEVVRQHTFSVPSALDDLQVWCETAYSANFGDDNSRAARKRLRAIIRKNGSYSLAVWRSGVFIGVTVVALLTTFTILYGSAARQRLPNYSMILQVYAILMLPCLLSLLTGLNWLAWDAARINVPLVFSLARKTHIARNQYYEMPAFLLCLSSLILMGTVCLASTPADVYHWIVIWLFSMLVFMCNPLPVFHHHARCWFLRSTLRVPMSGFIRVEFRDFWLGDELCSLYYSTSNFYRCALKSHFSTDITSKCSPNESWITPFLACMPFIFRFGHSARRYYDEQNKSLHLVNMCKYSLSVVYLFIYYDWRIQGSQANRVKVLFIIIATMNSLASYTWDVWVDWDLGYRRASFPMLRPKLAYGKHVWFYYFSIAINLILRFSWTIYLTGIPYTSALSFLSALMEVFRRWIWNYIRVEAENSGNVDDFRVARTVPLPYANGKSDRKPFGTDVNVFQF